jgi:hypothetical protein
MSLLIGAPAYNQAQWESFAVAQVGAAAALAGLVVVATSINLARIIEIPAVVTRLAATLSLFTGVLVTSSVLLIPGQGIRLTGVEIAAVGIVLIPIVVRRAAWTGLDQEYRRSAVLVVVLGGFAVAGFLVAGLSCSTLTGGGLYWLAPATLLAFCVGLVNAWVALVEILR